MERPRVASLFINITLWNVISRYRSILIFNVFPRLHFMMLLTNGSWLISLHFTQFFFICFTFFFFRSLPKLSSQDEDGPTPHAFTGVVHFEPIPHDHDFCERVVINVSPKKKKKILLLTHFLAFYPVKTWDGYSWNDLLR